MGLAYATRNPTPAEDSLLRLMLSTYRDGSGNCRESDGTTRPEWRQIERCVAELLGTKGGEDKGIFDLIAPDPDDARVAYGFSVKSKQLSKRAFAQLSTTSRVYMEIANSPAKFWAAIRMQTGYSEAEFRAGKDPQSIGDTVLRTVSEWHAAGKRDFEKTNQGVTLDIASSRYLCVSYSNDEADARQWQVQSFGLAYPKGLTWFYSSDLCLSAEDPDHPGERILDWYGLSGGQLKYYPRGTSACFQSAAFCLRNPPSRLSVAEKAKLYFPEEFD